LSLLAFPLAPPVVVFQLRTPGEFRSHLSVALAPVGRCARSLPAQYFLGHPFRGRLVPGSPTWKRPSGRSADPGRSIIGWKRFSFSEVPRHGTCLSRGVARPYDYRGSFRREVKRPGILFPIRTNKRPPDLVYRWRPELSETCDGRYASCRFPSRLGRGARRRCRTTRAGAPAPRARSTNRLSVVPLALRG
jgi:hypothetical protein